VIGLRWEVKLAGPFPGVWSGAPAATMPIVSSALFGPVQMTEILEPPTAVAGAWTVAGTATTVIVLRARTLPPRKEK